MPREDTGVVLGKLAVGTVLREWVHGLIYDEVSALSAELAYYFFLSLFPFFIFLTSLGGFAAALFHTPDPTEQVINVLSSYMPPEATRLVRPEIERVVHSQVPGTFSLGLVFALWVATSGASAIIRAMNRAYDVAETRPFWRRYLLAFGLTVLTASVLVAAFSLFIGARVFGEQIASAVGLGDAYGWILRVMSWLFVVILIAPGSALLYWAAPNIHLRAVWIVPGAVFFTAGWLATTWLFALYVQWFGSYGATYGTLGGVAVLLIWFYLTGMLLLAGGELNAAIDRQVDPESVEQERQRAMSRGKPEAGPQRGGEAVGT